MPDTTGTATQAYVSQLDGILAQMVDTANTKNEISIYSVVRNVHCTGAGESWPVPDPAVQPYIYAGNEAPGKRRC